MALLHQQAEEEFRGRIAGFTCKEELFLEEGLAAMPRTSLSELHSLLDAEMRYLQCCGHAEVEDILEDRKGWRDRLEAALKRKRVRRSSPPPPAAAPAPAGGQDQGEAEQLDTSVAQAAGSGGSDEPQVGDPAAAAAAAAETSE